MLTQQEVQEVIALAKKYEVGKLYVVGSASALQPMRPEPQDYDFAIADYPPGSFFKFYADLSQKMSREVDLIDISGKPSLFKKLVAREGKLLYEREAA